MKQCDILHIEGEVMEKEKERPKVIGIGIKTNNNVYNGAKSQLPCAYSMYDGVLTDRLLLQFCILPEFNGGTLRAKEGA